VRIIVAGAAALTREGHVMNLGDEAIAETIVGAIGRHRGISEVVATLNTRLANRAAPTGRFSPRPVHRLAHEVARADAVLIGGGTLLQDNVPIESSWRLRGLLRLQLAVVALCRSTRTPYAYALVGAEYLERPAARRAVRFLVEHAACVAVRDPASAELLTSFATPQRLAVGADAVFLAATPVPRGQARTRVAVSLLSLAQPELIKTLARSLDALFPHAHLLLVPTDRRVDCDGVALRILQQSLMEPSRVSWFAADRPWQELVAELGSCQLAVGMRMHFLMLAALARTPAVVIAASPKLRSFAADGALALVDARAPAGLNAALADAAAMDELVFAALRRRAETGLACCLQAVGAK
jgi:polysaccharide pyruvyl transferase WcaK-like protein